MPGSLTSKTLGEAAVAKLRFVKGARSGRDLSRFPDFMIVGPQRTGTTWLHRHLRDHPDILWPRRKELFYFSSLNEPESAKFESADLDWYLAEFNDTPTWALIKRAMSLKSFGRWYAPRVVGEATASYAAMPDALIDEVLVLNPNLRAVMMVRNPVDRAWSHAKKDLVRNRGRRHEDVGDDEFREFFSEEYQRRCARYVDNIGRWRQRLRPDHLWVGRFDDIETRPAELLREVTEFIGARYIPKRFDTSVATPVNPTGGESIPHHHREFLETLLAEDLRALDAELGMRWERG